MARQERRYNLAVPIVLAATATSAAGANKFMPLEITTGTGIVATVIAGIVAVTYTSAEVVTIIVALGGLATIVGGVIVSIITARINAAAKDAKVTTTNAIEALKIDTARKLEITTEITKALEEQRIISTEIHEKAVEIKTLADGTNSILTRDLRVATEKIAGYEALIASMTEAKHDAAAARVTSRTDIASAEARAPATATAPAGGNAPSAENIVAVDEAIGKLKKIATATTETAANTRATKDDVKSLKKKG